MQNQLQPWLALTLALEGRHRKIDRAARARGVARRRPSIRRAIGHRIIAIGARVAAEPHFELARTP